MAIPFSTISQDPQVRAIVQDGALERAFHDALFPRILFRGEAEAIQYPGNVGDSMVFTGAGLIPRDQRALRPGIEPTSKTWPKEQWSMLMQQYADSIDTPMATSIVAIANLFLENAHQVGLQAAQVANAHVRNRMYNAAESGNTVVDGAGQSSTAIRVKSINGFTKARRPDLAATGGSVVKFDYVSSNNPLPVTIGGVARNVTNFAGDFGDETGPGTITLDVTIAPADRAAVLAADRAIVTRVGGGSRMDDITSLNLLTMASIRTVVARMRQNNVPEHSDGRFHVHLDPASEDQLFSDAELQRKLTALPDHYMYRQFAVGETNGCVFFRNSECPLPETLLPPVTNPVTGVATSAYSDRETFAGETYSNSNSATGVKIHRVLFTCQGGIKEYYVDQSPMITEAGTTGKRGTFQITNNGIDVMSDRILCIIRAPLDKLQQEVTTSWSLMADWPVRTDVTTGDASRFKRLVVLAHGE
jgi:hypothetical protein